MIQYNTSNVKQSSSKRNKLNSGIKNGTDVTLKLSSNDFGDSNDDNNLLQLLLLTNTQAAKLHNAFANNSKANIKLSKTKFHKIGLSRGFLGRPLRRLLKPGLHLMKKVI